MQIKKNISGLTTSILVLTTTHKVNQSTTNNSKVTPTTTEELEVTVKTTSATMASSVYPIERSTSLPSSTTAVLITTISSITDAELMTTSGMPIEETTPHTFTMTTTDNVFKLNQRIMIILIVS